MNKRKDAPMVIVGVDGSAPSVEALRQAEKLAIRMGAQVQALACWSPPGPGVELRRGERRLRKERPEYPGQRHTSCFRD